jgi:hypothetical protein
MGAVKDGLYDTADFIAFAFALIFFYNSENPMRGVMKIGCPKRRCPACEAAIPGGKGAPGPEP